MALFVAIPDLKAEVAVRNPTLHRYGPYDSQVAELYLPENSHTVLVCLLHGGFWRLPYGRDEMTAIAQDLVGRGYAVWNMEYRRIGEQGGGWPGTLMDVRAGIDHLATVQVSGSSLD